MLADAGVPRWWRSRSRTVEARQQLAEAFEPRGLVGCVGHIERYNPALQETSGPG